LRLILGIDGGGTGCRAAVAKPGGVILGRGQGGPANIRTDLDGAAANILAATGAALSAAGLGEEAQSRLVAVLGLAGANVGGFAAAIRARLPFARAQVENDGTIALEGAIGPGDGAIGIVGTGSVFVARSGGAVRQVGGWGFELGDQGSGAWLGRLLLEEALLAHDGLRPAGALAAEVLAELGGPAAAVGFAMTARPVDYGAFAPRIVAAAGAGDAHAGDLLDRAAGRVKAALAALDPGGRLPVALLGGLAVHVGARLTGPLRARLVAPRGDALSGAVAMAERLAAGKDE
jgi:glucosamine kinase